MKVIDKKIEKINKQIELLKQQKKAILEEKKSKEKLVELSETKKKHLLRLGKILDEAGIRTQKEVRELIEIRGMYLSKHTDKDLDKDIEVIEEEELINTDEPIEIIEEIKQEDRVKEIKPKKTSKSSQAKIEDEEISVPKQSRKEKFGTSKKKLDNSKSKEKTRNRLFG